MILVIKHSVWIPLNKFFPLEKKERELLLFYPFESKSSPPLSQLFLGKGIGLTWTSAQQHFHWDGLKAKIQSPLSSRAGLHPIILPSLRSWGEKISPHSQAELDSIQLSCPVLDPGVRNMWKGFFYLWQFLLQASYFKVIMGLEYIRKTCLLALINSNSRSLDKPWIIFLFFFSRDMFEFYFTYEVECQTFYSLRLCNGMEI